MQKLSVLAKVDRYSFLTLTSHVNKTYQDGSGHHEDKQNRCPESGFHMSVSLIASAVGMSLATQQPDGPVRRDEAAV